MSLGFKANVDGSAAIQSNGADQITISPSGQVAFPNTTPSALGVGQTTQDVKASRALSTNYTNTTGRTIVVYVTSTNTATASLILTVDGIEVGRSYQSAINNSMTVVGVVPNNSVYKAQWNSGAGTIVNWTELR